MHDAVDDLGVRVAVVLPVGPEVLKGRFAELVSLLEIGARVERAAVIAVQGVLLSVLGVVRGLRGHELASGSWAAPRSGCFGSYPDEGGDVGQDEGCGPVVSVRMAARAVEYETFPAGRYVVNDDEEVVRSGADAVTHLEVGEVAGLGTSGVAVA